VPGSVAPFSSPLPEKQPLDRSCAVAEQSGGWFTLRSRKGEGTTAELWLPVAEGRFRQLVEEKSVDAVVDQGSLIALAVDDDGLVLTNTLAMLDDLGHTGIAASSGKEALDILRQQGSVDLVITGFAMPKMNGMQLAEAIKKGLAGTSRRYCYRLR
jgi:hypothetical protein